MSKLREVKDGQGETLNQFFFKGDIYNKEQKRDEKIGNDYYVLPNPNLIENFSDREKNYFSDSILKRDNAEDDFYFENPNLINNFSEEVVGLEVSNKRVLRENGSDEFEFGENYPNLIFEVVYV